LIFSPKYLFGILQRDITLRKLSKTLGYLKESLDRLRRFILFLQAERKAKIQSIKKAVRKVRASTKSKRKKLDKQKLEQNLKKHNLSLS
jgi:hypothetical protein